MGTLTPKYFGGFFNTFTYKGLSLYVGITYKLGYIFQKPTISQQPASRYGGANYEINEDMAKRWVMRLKPMYPVWERITIVFNDIEVLIFMSKKEIISV